MENDISTWAASLYTPSQIPALLNSQYEEDDQLMAKLNAAYISRLIQSGLPLRVRFISNQKAGSSGPNGICENHLWLVRGFQNSLDLSSPYFLLCADSGRMLNYHKMKHQGFAEFLLFEWSELTYLRDYFLIAVGTA